MATVLPASPFLSGPDVGEPMYPTGATTYTALGGSTITGTRTTGSLSGPDVVPPPVFISPSGGEPLSGGGAGMTGGRIDGGGATTTARATGSGGRTTGGEVLAGGGTIMPGGGTSTTHGTGSGGRTTGGEVLAGGGTIMPGGGTTTARGTGSGGGGRYVLGGGPAQGGGVFLKYDPFDHTSPYYFQDTMSRQVMELYLERAIEVSRLSDKGMNVGGPDGPNYPAYFDYTNPLTYGALTDTSYDHGALLQMIVDTGAKFTFETVQLEGGMNFEEICTIFALDCKFLHNHDREIIAGACISENVYYDSYFIPLPANISDFIGLFYPTGRYYASHPTQFYPEMMMVSYPKNPVFDITKPEARMFIYYMCTRYIDCGCEAIHLNDLFSSCHDDYGNANLWQLTTAIRNYAAVNARRGLVLLDSHVSFETGSDSPDSLIHSMYGWFYDDPNLLPFRKDDWERQLIFDFHTLGIYYVRNESVPLSTCFDPPLPRAQDGTSILPVKIEYGIGLINNSKGGLNPQGWHCTHNPAFLRLDYGYVDTRAGCMKSGFAVTSPVYPHPLFDVGPYGYDNTSWFSHQIDWVRQDILIYFFYKIHCLDINSHFCMPGRLVVNERGYAGQLYYLAFSETTTIKNIWLGLKSETHNWVYHNFSDEYVTPFYADVASDLVFVGTDAIYYIANDGYIHGCIYSASDDVWFYINVSYAAETYPPNRVPIASQSKAANSLVASPGGSVLLYIGTDGYIHQITIHSPWAYEYLDFMKGSTTVSNSMVGQGIKAADSLIYPTAYSIYYISSQVAGIPLRTVHGFQKSSGTWNTVSPTYSAIAHGAAVSAQKTPAGALTYDPNHTIPRLFYRGNDGLLYYFDIASLVDYYYNAANVNAQLIAQDLQIVGNLALYYNRIYYVGRYKDGSMHIHCMIDTGAGWVTMSPSYSADYYNHQPIASQIQSDASGQIAVSPDGKNIAYFGIAQVCYYYNIDDVTYVYSTLPYVKPSPSMLSSLQFIDNENIFFISPYYGNISQFRFQEDYCNNSIIDFYETFGY